jgi:hypothetical protein
MKSNLLAVTGAALLFAASGIAHAQATQPSWSSDQSSAQQTGTQAATPTQMSDKSMGGASMMGKSDSGKSGYIAPCVIGLSCDIYRGN